MSSFFRFVLIKKLGEFCVFRIISKIMKLSLWHDCRRPIFFNLYKFLLMNNKSPSSKIHFSYVLVLLAQHFGNERLTFKIIRQCPSFGKVPTNARVSNGPMRNWLRRLPVLIKDSATKKSTTMLVFYIFFIKNNEGWSIVYLGVFSNITFIVHLHYFLNQSRL